MRGHPCIPHALDDVELAGALAVADVTLGPPRLVLGVHPRGVHRRLVERHEAQAVEATLTAGVEPAAEAIEHRRAAGGGDLGWHEGLRLEAGDIDQVGDPAREVDVLEIRDREHLRVKSGDGAAGIEDPPVGEDDDARRLADLLDGEQLGHQLGADASGVALNQG